MSDQDRAAQEAAEILKYTPFTYQDHRREAIQAVAAALRARDERYEELKQITHNLQNEEARRTTALEVAQAELAQLRAQVEGLRADNQDLIEGIDGMIRDREYFEALAADAERRARPWLCDCHAWPDADEAHAYIVALERREREVELKYRRQLWLNHGHQALYGDDGEMQCGRCVADFKRFDLEKLEQIVDSLRMQAIRAAIEAEKGREDGK